MTDRGDADLSRLRQMEKNVRRCQHKMKAFVRFREVGARDAPRRSFAAWFEPTHHTIEPTAKFFTNRFADMDWRIYTPDVSAIFEGGKLRFTLDQPRPDLPEDAGEDLWITYFQNIFNPARLKVQAMQSEMPKKYWKNLPEAASIPHMIAEAPARAREMALAAPTLPPARVAKIQDQQASFASSWQESKGAFDTALQGCTRCPLHKTATQAVAGEGPLDAKLMILGEQPGDLEDLQGRPFVGPAGQLFDQIALAADLQREQVYLTNAVKHFKFKPANRRRIHQRPNTTEVSHCRWWLSGEITRVQPRIILAMGATAALALTGNGKDIGARRGQFETSSEGMQVLITFHPSYLLREPDPARQRAAQAAFQQDLTTAWNRALTPLRTPAQK